MGRNPAKYNTRQRKKHRPTVEERDITFLEKFIDLPRAVDVDRYCSLFDGKGESITGDITPAYSALEPPTITRLAERLPDLKVVFIARDPVERLWSQYSMKIRKKQAPEVIDVDSVLAFASLPSIVSRSFPSRIVDRWRSFFPKEQMGLFFFDELRTDAAGIRKKILGFLGADNASQSGELSPGHNSKQRLKKYAMTDEVRAALCEYFSEEISLYAEQFGGPAVDWGARDEPTGSQDQWAGRAR